MSCFFNKTKINVNRSCSLCCCWSCCFTSNSKCRNINNAWAPPLWHAKCGSTVVGVYLSQNVDVKPLEHLLILQWKTTMESKAQWEICMELQGNSGSLHRKWRVLTGWFQAVRCSLCVDSCRKQQTLWHTSYNAQKWVLSQGCTGATNGCMQTAVTKLTLINAG